jgi:hypothetical protein
MLGYNRGFETSSISVEVEAYARSIHKGGGSGDSFKTINDQWTSTADPSTQGHKTIFF